MTVPLNWLERYRRGDEFVKAALAAGRADGFALHIDEKAWAALLEKYPERITGLGDVVAAIAKPIAKAVGLEDCGSCEERRAWLNEKVPFQ